MRNILILFAATLSVLTLSACDNGKKGGSAVAVCPAPYVLSPDGSSCIGGGLNPDDGGIIPGGALVGYVQYYDYNRYFMNSMWGLQTYSGDMQIVNNNAYKTFLKEALAVCDRAIWGGNYGLADCNSWIAGSLQVSWRMDGNMRPVISFEAYPAPTYYGFALSWGINAGGMAFNPLILNQGTTFNMVNNSQGFEIRSNGSYMNGGGLKLIQIIVRNGKISDNTVSYEIYYPHNKVATLFARGTFKRY